MTPMQAIIARARVLERHILLPEAGDPRIREAAAIAAGEGIARVTLLDPDPQDFEDLVAAYHDLRRAKGVTEAAARAAMRDPIRQAAMRVRLGQAHGTVAGAVATTSDTVRAALQIISRATNARIVSSFFLMLGGPTHPVLPGGIIFSDCGLVVAPSAEDLAAIALSAAASCRQLLDQEPQVAMLSFSTAGSAEHPSVTRVRDAVALVRAEAPDLAIDGEMQFDAAFSEAIRARKAPGSPLRGTPNVFIFPDLNAGNIGYKIAERLGGLKAVGPILQGLAKPANDLSRGCSVEDIVAAIAVTAVQSEG
jgi:phosphate acetyltransferase